MKRLAKVLLKAVTLAVPVVIAACYGMPMQTRRGRVIDAATSQPIRGIQVSCVIGDVVNSQTTTWDDGTFDLEYDEPCAVVRAEDTDGAENGSYQTAEVNFSEGPDDLVIPLTAVQ